MPLNAILSPFKALSFLCRKLSSKTQASLRKAYFNLLLKHPNKGTKCCIGETI